MQKEIDEGKFIESAEVHGNLYGTSVASVETIQKQGKICILEVDIQGLEVIRKTKLNPIILFVFPPSFEALAERLKGRGSETEETMNTRLNTAKKELEIMESADYVDVKIYNDDFDKAYTQLVKELTRLYPQLSSNM